MHIQRIARNIYVSETRASDWVEDTAAGPQTADENGRRDEKGDDEEGLGLWGHAQDMPSMDGPWLAQAEISRDCPCNRSEAGTHCG
ncbi:hypothetical protein TWF481_007237 [Arthrobotrys musiformis]|uniref:Uncharacterized protein n=1 Tax=Arthrobotrys musiformis TaxID=47236 RepID=A0AAV9WCS0_9PEZI